MLHQIHFNHSNHIFGHRWSRKSGHLELPKAYIFNDIANNCQRFSIAYNKILSLKTKILEAALNF
jgi:hypothetical protein